MTPKDRYDNRQSSDGPGEDPLGLRGLPPLEPPRDDWQKIRAALATGDDATAREERAFGEGAIGEQAAESGATENRAAENGATENGTADRTQRWMPALALAASLLLVTGLVLWLPDRGAQLPGNATGAGLTELAQTPLTNALSEDPVATDSMSTDRSREQLVGLSQVMEQRLRLLRDQVGYLPSESALYVAELEDLIAQVDGQLSARPDSLDLWSQRVNLMLDLEVIFQHQFDREYGRMASL